MFLYADAQMFVSFTLKKQCYNCWCSPSLVECRLPEKQS